MQRQRGETRFCRQSSSYYQSQGGKVGVRPRELTEGRRGHEEVMSVYSLSLSSGRNGQTKKAVRSFDRPSNEGLDEQTNGRMMDEIVVDHHPGG
mmetsp:Transcript_39429/g.77574  ORF Transcript_39429/g.77574 Transcript_39429/m.77574 type:complete len:94 (-) Transcript_39429:2165-2446(-)